MQYIVIQQALNYLIKSSNTDIGALNGKSVRFSLQDLPLNIDFVFTNNRAYVLSNSEKNIDVNISLKSIVFVALIRGEELSELLKQDKIIVNGDIKTAQTVADLLNDADIDLEEELSKFTGDIVANKAGNIVNKIKSSTSSIKNPMDIVRDGLIDLLVRPSKSKQYKNKNI
jgi:ubiquinone biosynthesis protein UbiJ